MLCVWILNHNGNLPLVMAESDMLKLDIFQDMIPSFSERLEKEFKRKFILPIAEKNKRLIEEHIKYKCQFYKGTQYIKGCDVPKAKIKLWKLIKKYLYELTRIIPKPPESPPLEDSPEDSIVFHTIAEILSAEEPFEIPLWYKNVVTNLLSLLQTYYHYHEIILWISRIPVDLFDEGEKYWMIISFETKEFDELRKFITESINNALSMANDIPSIEKDIDFIVCTHEMARWTVEDFKFTSQCYCSSVFVTEVVNPENL